MRTKLIASTEAQNNFGRVLDDVVQHGTRYIIRRRSASQAIMLSIADFEALLQASDAERSKLSHLLREHSPAYTLGETVQE
jgi:prevent-host-death family protein